MADIDGDLKVQLDSIAKKNKVRQPDESAMNELSDPAKAQAIGISMFEGADVFSFCRDLLALSDPVEDDSEGPPPIPGPLENLKIEGESAWATVTFEGEDSEEIRFIRVQDRWYVVTE